MIQSEIRPAKMSVKFGTENNLPSEACSTVMQETQLKFIYFSIDLPRLTVSSVPSASVINGSKVSIENEDYCNGSYFEGEYLHCAIDVETGNGHGMTPEVRIQTNCSLFNMDSCCFRFGNNAECLRDVSNHNTLFWSNVVNRWTGNISLASRDSSSGFQTRFRVLIQGT